MATKLRTGRPLRRRRRRAHERFPRFVAPGRLIDQRPPAVESRSRLGDWEGDLITGRSNRAAIGTLVERHSRYLRLVHLAGGRTADEVRDALSLVRAEMPEAARLTLTWDQGTEMARHDEIAYLFAEGISFAYPGRPWQRGSNENANGLLRQYFPKRSDLGTYTPADLAAVEERLNSRPRKTWAENPPRRCSQPHYGPDRPWCCDGRSNPPGSIFSRR